MGDWVRGWTRVGQADPTHSYNRFWEIERELDEQRTISAWDNDDNWPSMYAAPLYSRFKAQVSNHENITETNPCLAAPRPSDSMANLSSSTISDMALSAASRKSHTAPCASPASASFAVAASPLRTCARRA